MPRPKKPLAQKKLEGTFRKDRDQEQEEAENIAAVMLPDTSLKVPSEITDRRVRRAYKDHIELLHSIGIMAEQVADTPLLKHAYICLQEATMIFQKMCTYDMLSDEYGKLEKMFFHFMNSYERTVKEFYITPSARAKLKLDILTATEKQLHIEEHTNIIADLLKKKTS